MSSHLRPGNSILPISFFKILLKTNLQRLKIPNKFTRRYGSALSNPVFLKPPDGTQWKVYWKKENGHEVWFQKGWKEFTQNYSLDHGCLVVFEYDGTSELDVFILDQSFLEIDYPLCNNCDDDESVQILKKIPPSKKNRQKLPLFSPQPRKRMRGEKGGTQRNTSSLNWPTDPRTQEVATNFISYNPFFTMFIKPVYLTEYKVCVPSLEGFIENEDKNVVLQFGERSWDVKLRRCHSPRVRSLTAGWSLFAHESELQPGDICIFELVNMDDSVFKVHVFKEHT